MLYNFMKYLLMPLFYIFFKIEIIGNNNLEDEKAYIVASNHKNMLDPVLVAIALKKRKIHYLAKKELFDNKILKFILIRCHVIPIDRSKSDIKAFKQAYKVLKENHILGIFPQGTRVKRQEDDNTKAGIGLFAIRTNTPVIPVSIISKKNYRLFSKIQIVFNEPYNVPQYMIEEKNNDNYLKFSNEIMDIIRKQVSA